MKQLKVETIRYRDPSDEWVREVEIREVLDVFTQRIICFMADIEDSEARAAHIVRCVNERDSREAMIKELREVIGCLMDVQNGCPLPKYQRDFDAANERALAALAAAGKGAE
jgi:hypothetical protein